MSDPKELEEELVSAHSASWTPSRLLEARAKCTEGKVAKAALPKDGFTLKMDSKACNVPEDGKVPLAQGRSELKAARDLPEQGKMTGDPGR